MTLDTTLRLPTSSAPNSRAPMAPAPMVYNDDNTVAWDQMWDTFCVLASAGGPPHRGTVLQAQTDADPTSAAYGAAVNEIIRGIKLVSGLTAQAAQPGWIAVECGQASKARWLSAQIQQENVAAYADGAQLFLPVGADFTLKGEIKNVITVVAKTTHYWHDHLAAEIKTSLVWEERLQRFAASLRRWFGQQPD